MLIEMSVDKSFEHSQVLGIVVMKEKTDPGIISGNYRVQVLTQQGVALTSEPMGHEEALELKKHLEREVNGVWASTGQSVPGKP